MRRVVRGFWGHRKESAEALTRRWKLTLDQLAEILPVGGSGAVSTWRRIHADGPGRAVTVRTGGANGPAQPGNQGVRSCVVQGSGGWLRAA
ncbi:hypothetical protein [Streptomyces sp. NPDC002785]|uniref:hypothetical protein n=1 Tax=Streptomyces sp. NPDC002785 TaxID=3154543 RepID=UPI00332736D8